MPSPPPAPPAADAADRPALTRRELAIIAAVWALYAFLSVASRLFDPRPDGPPPTAPVVVALLEALGWALLTPPILLMAERYGVDRDRGVRLLAFALLGLAVAGLMGWATTELRQLATPFSGRPRRMREAGPFGRGGGRGPRAGPPLWFAFVNALVLYFTVLAAGIARALSRRYHARREEAARREARLEAQLAEARLDALRRQLDPHFLFNTLNAVSALVERDPRGVRRMIARLSELLRASFEGADRAQVPLREELALLTRYVEIMQVRFQGRLAVETHADDAALDVPVPSLILQPLVENAIRHGVEKIAGQGHVTIGARLDGDALVLRVTDNGPGPAPDAARAATGEGTRGVGLRNTIARLQQLYGDAQRFTIGAGAQGGTVAEIRLPRGTIIDAGAPTAGAADVR